MMLLVSGTVKCSYNGLNQTALKELSTSGESVLYKKKFSEDSTRFYCSDGSCIDQKSSGEYVISPKVSLEMLSNNRVLIKYSDGTDLVMLPSGALAFHFKG